MAKRRAHTQDNERKQNYLKTDIDYGDRLETSSFGVPNGKKTAAPANDEVSNEVAEILQSLRSETNGSGRKRPRTSWADQSVPGLLLDNSPAHGAPHWTKSMYTGFFEEMDDATPKPTEMDWSIPQRKQDRQGRGYYSSGKMNGKRRIWKRDSLEWLMWSPRTLLEDETRKEIGETFSFKDEACNKETIAVGEVGATGKDEGSDEDTERRAEIEDTGSGECGDLKRKWMATGNFWED